MSPVKGSSSSKTRKIAPANDSAKRRLAKLIGKAKRPVTRDRQTAFPKNWRLRNMPGCDQRERARNTPSIVDAPPPLRQARARVEQDRSVHRAMWWSASCVWLFTPMRRVRQGNQLSRQYSLPSSLSSSACLSPEQVIIDFVSVLKSYRCHRVSGDRFGGRSVCGRCPRAHPSTHCRRGLLYTHQSDGVAFLISKGRAILGDDMGLAKPARPSSACRSQLPV